MKKGLFLSALVMGMMCISFPAEVKAQDNVSDSVLQDSLIILEEITVRGKVRSEELESTSATILRNEDIVNRVYVTPLDMLTQSPGVNIMQYGENGVAAQVKMRGFGGSHGSDVAIMLDGIPLHDGGHSDGYVDTSIIVPIEIEKVEIIKGPASVLYGKNSAGGAVAYHTYQSGDFTRLNLTYGSYNTADVSGIVARQDGRLDHVYSFQVYHTDGYRDNSDWDRQNFSGRWTYRASTKLRFSLNLRAADSTWNSAGYIPSFVAPKKAVDDGSGQGNGGERSRTDARIWVNYDLDDRSQLTAYAFGTDLDNTRFRLDWNTVQGAIAGSDQKNTRKAFGTGVLYNHKSDINGRDFSFVSGIEYLKEKEDRDEWRLHWGTGRTQGAKFRDYEYTLNTVSAYGEAIYQVIEPVKVRAGLRYDRFSGEMDTGAGETLALLGANNSYDAEERDFFSPKLGIIYTPVYGFETYANYSRGFSLPGLSNGQFFAKDDYDITERDQYELGYRAKPFNWLNIDMAYYIIYTDKDVTRDPMDPGVEIQAGKTKREGLETTLKVYPAKNWYFTLDYTYQEARYKEHGTATADLSGRRLALTPRHITNIEVEYAPEVGFGARARYNWNADMVVDVNPGSVMKYRHDYGQLDLQVNYRFNERYRLNLDIKNALDSEFYGNQGTYNTALGYYTYSPINPLTAYLTLDVKF